MDRPFAGRLLEARFFAGAVVAREAVASLRTAALFLPAFFAAFFLAALLATLVPTAAFFLETFLREPFFLETFLRELFLAPVPRR